MAKKLESELKESNEKVSLVFDDGSKYPLNVKTDAMGKKSINITSLYKDTGYTTFDPGYANTASCCSSICFIDGENGILRYRGYDIEDLVEQCDFVEVAHLLVKGYLPNKKERINYQNLLNKHSLLHISMQDFFKAYPSQGHPMSILSAMVASLSAFYPELYENDPQTNIDLTVTRLLSKMRTIAAYTYRQMNGLSFVEPSSKMNYCENFLNMMFYSPVNDYKVDKLHVKALNQLLIMHADHEQNCSTSTVRLVGSSDANLYAAIAAGCCALWGPKHGGANQDVMDTLLKMENEKISPKEIIEKAKSKSNPYRLPGFGHRIYKTFDPRAKIAKKLCLEIRNNYQDSSNLIDTALALQELALKDDYFKTRNLYPNIDFFTGLTFHMLGIPQNMFTVLFAMGRLPGWIAQYLEGKADKDQKIGRPRQAYIGPVKRDIVPIDKR